MPADRLTVAEKVANEKAGEAAKVGRDPNMPSQKPGESHESFKARTQAYIKERDSKKKEEKPMSLGDLAKKAAQERAVKEAK